MTTNDGGEFRIEKDTLGEVKVPADALYGAQTQRARENFQISGMPPQPDYLWGMIMIKKAAALANRDTGRLPKDVADAIVAAADEALEGRHQAHFVIDPWQAGAGTSHNMNVNEVLATRATQILAEDGRDVRVHPNDHVNLAQSSNDTNPTAVRLGALRVVPTLLNALERLRAALEMKATEFDRIVKPARTHLQDAVPIRLGQEFSGYAAAVGKAAERIAAAAVTVGELNIGATAAGTGINAEPDYIDGIVGYLKELTGFELRRGENFFRLTQSGADLAHLSSAVRNAAVEISRIASDLRLLASGPRTAIAEIILPPVQPGSSIMPGKVNPSMAEMMNMVCFQVIGCDEVCSLAAHNCQLDLNVFWPSFGFNLMFGMTLLRNGVTAFTDRCVAGIQADEERARELVEQSLMLVTALTDYIGYEEAAAIAKQAYAERRTIRELVRERGLMSDEQLDKVLDALPMTEPGVPGRE
ncbi:MAG TPA: aspartate ammonia-lyase [Actinomycetota bacterium]|nr:aspartate ammonia-lyase [Actinomycetota bacterium]